MPVGSLLRSLMLVVLAFGSWSANAGAAQVDFTRDIQPIFQARCVGCHGPEKQRSGLRLDRREAALAGGDSGAVITPGKGDDSALIRRVTSKEKSFRMPPAGDPLTGEQMVLLRAW